MCGIAGILNFNSEQGVDEKVLSKMIHKLKHRGPDDLAIRVNANVGFGFSRLSIIGLSNGMQPLFNADKSVVLVCNGEIFNYQQLKIQLLQKGHQFETDSDCEVILYLYAEYGVNFLNKLNGQFAFALYDYKKKFFFAARDQFGIAPFFYTVVDGALLFGSEIKALLECPSVKRDVDMRGLDQIFTFPGLVSPKTLFKNIHSLPSGHYLTVTVDKKVVVQEYWDVAYPKSSEIQYEHSDAYYQEKAADLFAQSVKARLTADVPVGFFVSGGLDSSMVAGKVKQLTPETQRLSFAINVAEKDLSESKYQRVMAKHLNSTHSEYLFQPQDIVSRLKDVIYHAECALKETYNTASFALSAMVRKHKTKVILAGEGADEFFAGYIGYRFDQFNQNRPRKTDVATLQENALRYKLWGDENFIYEKEHVRFNLEKKNIYAKNFQDCFDDIDSTNEDIISKDKISGIDVLHKRSYIDFKLRLVDHLLGDHGDRMAFANSVECRYPFLDKDLIEFAMTMPPRLKLNDFDEKYILKKIAHDFVPKEIIQREKFGFTAPGSPYLLSQNNEYINDLLSYDRIKKEGYFDPDAITALKKQYSEPGFRINVPFDSDLLTTVITFGIFLEMFAMPRLG